MDTSSNNQAQLKRKLDQALILLLLLSVGTTVIVIRQIVTLLANQSHAAHLQAAIIWGAVAVGVMAAAAIAAKLVISSQSQLSKLFEDYGNALRTAEEQSEALRRIRQSLIAGLESVQDAVITADMGERVTYINPVAEKLTAWQAADAIGKPLSKIFQVVHKDTRAELNAPASSALKDFVPVEIDSHALLIGVSGLETVIGGIAVPIWDENQNVVGVTLAFRDIAEQNAGNEALRAVQTRYLATMETSMDAILTGSYDGKITEANVAAATMFGLPRAKLQGASIADLLVLPIGKYKTLPELMESINGAEADMPVETMGRRADGTQFPVLLNMTSTRARDGRMLTMCAQDLTEQCQLQTKLQVIQSDADAADSVRSRFLAKVSDELRTPLNAVIGYSEILMEEAEEQLKPEYRSDLGKIHDGGKHLLSLINHMLNLAKIETDMAGLFLESFDIKELVDSIAKTVQPTLESNNNRLQVFYASNVGTIQADRIKLQQSLINALNNVCKFTTLRTITLFVACESQQDGEWVTFRIADAASRMAPKQISEFLESFPESNIAATKKSADVGLALEVSRKLCRMMGGDLVVESQPGKGSMYVISLPEVVQAGTNTRV